MQAVALWCDVCGKWCEPDKWWLHEGCEVIARLAEIRAKRMRDQEESDGHLGSRPGTRLHRHA